MKLRLAAPRRLVDLRHLRGALGGVGAAGDSGAEVTVGALTTYHALASHPLLSERYPVLCEVAGAIGDLQVRNCGTLGGSLAHADPAGDLPAVVLALDARLEAASRGGATRRLDAAEFFRGAYTTALAPGELLTRVHLPALPARTGAAYAKFRNPASGYAVVGIAACVGLGEDGRVATARVGVTGVGEVAYRARDCEAALIGQEPSAERLHEAAARAAAGVEPLDDVYASGEYRTYLTGVFAERALSRALERARGAA